MRKKFKALYERPDLWKEDYLKMMGYDMKSLTSRNSDDNPGHVDVNNVINNEEKVVETGDIEAVLV